MPWPWIVCMLIVVAIAAFAAGATMSAGRTRRKMLSEFSTNKDGLFRKIACEYGDIAFSVDLESNRIEWDEDLGKRLLGYGADELVVQPETFDQVIYEDDIDAFLEAWKSIPEGKKVDMDVRLLMKDGKPFWTHFIVLSEQIEGDDELHVQGVVWNTDLFRNALKDAERAKHQRTMGVMAAGMAHEFNNHLTPIRGYIELAIDSLGERHPVSEGLLTAQEQVDYCSGLVEQIQAYGRISYLVKSHEDVAQVLPSAFRVALATDPDGASRITQIRRWPEVLPTVMVDKAQLRQALVHLLRNAMQAMPDGGTMTLEAKAVNFVEHRENSNGDTRSGEYICIRVEDTGWGMSNEVKEKIFDPFFTTQRQKGGTGMGLPMVQGMVEQHGGWLEIESEPGAGTDVRMYLPISKAIPEKFKQDADGTMTVLPAANTGRMLVADDEDHIRKLVRKIFDNEGWETEEVEDYHGVLAKIDQGETYDLLILDVTMNGPTLDDTLPRILSALPQAKILLISGTTTDEHIQDLASGKHAVFMNKPFSPTGILTQVDRMFAN